MLSKTNKQSGIWIELASKVAYRVTDQAILVALGT